ncbi:MAG: 3-hydroxyacyl-ACP dehydratase FabZ [Pseudomonadota bacterium]|nr:3-hydroxyacyl-ACP dehydratase FabZ [Pseudomonadota bacterium]
MQKDERIDIEEIKRLIPHRYPFLLIDFVKNVNLGNSATGIKNVTINEPFFLGHFPQKPIMPGVLIVEALAQTAAVLVVKTLNQIDNELLVYFMSMTNTKFRKLVKPGDVMNLEVKVTQNRRNIWKFKGEAYVKDDLVSESEFTAMMVPPDEGKT